MGTAKRSYEQLLSQMRSIPAVSRTQSPEFEVAPRSIKRLKHSDSSNTGTMISTSAQHDNNEEPSLIEKPQLQLETAEIDTLLPSMPTPDSDDSISSSASTHIQSPCPINKVQLLSVKSEHRPMPEGGLTPKQNPTCKYCPKILTSPDIYPDGLVHLPNEKQEDQLNYEASGSDNDVSSINLQNYNDNNRNDSGDGTTSDMRRDDDANHHENSNQDNRVLPVLIVTEDYVHIKYAAGTYLKVDVYF